MKSKPLKASIQDNLQSARYFPTLSPMTPNMFTAIARPLSSLFTKHTLAFSPPNSALVGVLPPIPNSFSLADQVSRSLS